MAPLYRPPTQVTTRQEPYLALVTRADPAWSARKYREVQYEFGGRVFYYNPYQWGVYSRLSGTYPVGAQYGGPDPLIAENLEPTVGNPVPGIYEGVDDGKGWA